MYAIRSYYETLEKDPTSTKDEALLDLYRKLRPGELTTVESARGLINTLFNNPKRYDLTRVGRYKLNQKLSRPQIDVDAYDQNVDGLLSDEDMLDAIRYLMALHNGVDGYHTDDIDIV